MEIRTSTSADVPSVIDIDFKSYDEAWGAVRFNTHADSMRVAVIGGRVVGYCIVDDINRVVHIYRIAVSPGFRRMGVASRLIADVILSYPNEQLIRCKVNEYDLESQLFLKASTFQAIRTIGQNIIFEKRLDDA